MKIVRRLPVFIVKQSGMSILKNYPEDIIQEWSARATVRRFRKNASLCKRWVAVQDNKIVGFSDHGLNNEFWGLYVHKDYIGKGIGSRLLKIVEDSLKKRGCKKITLKAILTAKDFYRKHG
jgi:putative acetyltransferase